MKRFLAYLFLVLSLLWCNVGISGENKFTVQELNINLSNEYELQKIGIRKSQYHGFPYIFSFYAQVKEDKLISLLETCLDSFFLISHPVSNISPNFLIDSLL